MFVGQRIAAKRKEKQLTQTDLARLIGVAPASINQYEKEERNPNYEKLINIANALDTNIQFLLTGTSEEHCNDDVVAFALKFLNPDKKKKVFEYMKQIVGINYSFELFTDGPLSGEGYAHNLINKLKIKSLPVDPFTIADALNIRIIYTKSNPQCEGELIKGTDQPTIILRELSDNDEEYKHVRQRYTLAILIGHAIMPWHLRSNFYRMKDTRSSKLEDTFSIQARDFASNLLMPSFLVKPILKNYLSTSSSILQELEQLASIKFKVSLTVLLIQLAKLYSETFFVLKTKGELIDEKFVFNNLIAKDSVPNESEASLILSNPPKEKVVINNQVTESVWFKNGNQEKQIYEEIVYDPTVMKEPAFLVLLKSSH